MCERVAFEYNRSAHATWPERDGISLKRRFQGLNNKSKPTGTAYIPPNVERAKRLSMEIESKVRAIQLHDQDDDATSEPKIAAASESTPSADPFLMIFMKMESEARAREFEWKKEQAEERAVWKQEQADQRRREDEQRRQESLDREEREREARKREQQHEALMMTFMAKFLGSSN
ncbi:hypothetical protein DYB35_011127 [Aphanomyces astaci]|uniref:DUF6818 domain-containing protein n=1 Tax=Aphanomyces astaci TaxID=112090 RepID=A0A418DMG2_APHAT|nr:hypothetical protein DYB35_011127 [Aphanomyces astaci]